MQPLQIIAIVLSLGVTVVALAFTAKAVRAILAVLRGGTAVSRSDEPARRMINMLKESLLHTRMLQWHWIGILHWWVYAAFLFLSSAVAAGFVQLFDPYFELPVVGRWYIYGWFAELLGLFGTLGIIGLIIYRQVKNPKRLGRKSRFFGSNMAQAYFVEAMVLLESAAILFIRAAEYKLHDSTPLHFPLSHLVYEWLGYPSDKASLENIVIIVAMIKVVSAMAWLIVISNFLTMGVAWHRFTAWFNIFFKREASGRTALGAVKPLTSDGKPVTLDDIDDLDEDTVLGVGKIEDFSWKGILDFTSCTECGRCQSQCPAWNTDKPLSPKLMILAMRDSAYARAPYLQGKADATSEAGVRELERPLIGETGDEWFYMPEDGSAVIDADALWSCTTCGACVQQCPVDIEHVDHFVDMRRYQVLVESNFPAELNGLFKGLENKGNPWNMSSTARLDWAKDLPFEVKVVGEDLESLDEVEWLFWVGCAGAYEDRAKKTTRAVAELLNMAGVSFGVLGNGETCTGDSARRAGNEFVFQGLAQQNIETFKEFHVKKVVSTCAHCFNTLRNEYKEFGIELEVVHHTQLLNRLVREGKLTPIREGAGAASRTITYHDPCYLGRHNEVYEPPRELLQVLPGANYAEMERHGKTSFCCGAGGARMWMEEKLGERINLNRTKEAVGTGADQIAVGCPFCRVMLADGLTAEQAAGNAREEVEVLDVAQMLLASVKGESATRAPAPAQAAPKPAEAAERPRETAEKPAQATAKVAEAAEKPAATSGGSLFDAAPAAPAAPAAGGSLFDTPAPAETAEKSAGTSSGSLFDVAPAAPSAPSAPAEATEKPSSAAGGSLFDIAAEPTPAPAAAETSISTAGSLFDVAPDPAPAPSTPPAPAPQAAAEPAQSSSAPPTQQADISGASSLFDIAPATPAPVAPQPPAAPASDPETILDADDTPAAPTAAAPAVAPAASPVASPVAPAAALPDLSSGGSLFDIAAPAAPASSAPADPTPADPAPSDPTPADPETIFDAADDVPSAEPAQPEAAPEKSPKPSSGAANQPRTDADIHGSDSLFDL